MFEKCIPCNRIGESCVPNLMLLPFPALMQWCVKRQNHLGWSNQLLSEKSGIPLSTLSRIKAGDYFDCKYSTIRSLLITLIGGTTDEWPCNAQVDRELRQMEQLEQQASKLAFIESENSSLREQLATIESRHRHDCQVIHDEYREQISFLEEDLQAWRSMCRSKQ